MVDLKNHKKSRPLILDKRKKLCLIDNVYERSIFDLSIYDNEYFDTRFAKFIKRLNERNGRKIVAGSLRGKALKAVILNTYLRIALKIIVDTILNGDKIFFFKKIISIHLTELPTFRKFASKIKYKYIHQFDGVYPVLRVAISERVMYSISILKKVHNRGMRLNAFYYSHMSSMISYKIINDNLKLSKEWATVIRTNKIKYNDNTSGSSRRAGK